MDWVLGVLIAFFIFVPALRFHSVYVLKKASRVTNSGPIRERLVVAITGAVGSSLLALTGLNRIIGYPMWDQSSVVGPTLLVIALIMFSIPAFVWEWMYLTGRLEK